MRRFLFCFAASLAATYVGTQSCSAADESGTGTARPLTSTTSTVRDSTEFLTDLEQARHEATAQNKPILALFTGSDWCPWCKKLQEEVLDTDAFRQFAAAKLILFEADFPLQRELTQAQRQQNESLAERYGVAGFPTVLILDASGAIKGTTGYRPGGAENYVKELEQLLVLGEDRAPTDELMGCGYTAKQRIAYQTVAPGGVKAMLELEKYVRQSGLEHSLLELIKARVSQINGCAYCLDMHTKDARANAETEQRLFLLPVWHEAPCYTDRERAALEWAEQLTVISQHDISDRLYIDMRRHFTEKELVDLTFAIVAINGWNRLAISTRAPVGSYQPADAQRE